VVTSQTCLGFAPWIRAVVAIACWPLNDFVVVGAIRVESTTMMMLRLIDTGDLCATQMFGEHVS
jgi:hypothetical protein